MKALSDYHGFDRLINVMRVIDDLAKSRWDDITIRTLHLILHHHHEISGPLGLCHGAQTFITYCCAVDILDKEIATEYLVDLDNFMIKNIDDITELAASYMRKLRTKAVYEGMLHVLESPGS